MRHLNILMATLVLTCFAILPAAARAADLDDLEVTMDVMDELSSVDSSIALMEGPGSNDIDGIDDDVDDDESEYGDDGEYAPDDDMDEGASGRGVDTDEDYDDGEDEFEDHNGCHG